jgi:hypothetical protein
VADLLKKTALPDARAWRPKMPRTEPRLSAFADLLSGLSSFIKRVCCELVGVSPLKRVRGRLVL